MTVRGISSIRKLSTTQHDERELIPNFRSRVRELENEVQSWTISPTVPRSDDDRTRLLSYSKHKHILESTWPCVFVCFAQMHTILHTSSTFIHCFHANEMKWMWNPDSHLFTKQFGFAACMCVCVGVCNTTCKRKNDALECCVATMTCQLSVAQLSMRQLCAISVTRTHRATNISNNKYAISFFVHGKSIFLHLHLTWERLRCEQWPNKWTTQRIPFCPFGDYCIPTIHICKSLTLHINFGQDNAMYTLSAMWNMEIEYFVAFPFVHTFSRKHARRM